MTSSKTRSNAFASLPHENRKTWSYFVGVMAALLLCCAASSAQTATHAPGWVVITIGDYRTLHAKAYPPDREPEGPPVDATLTRVDYDLHIDGDLAAGRASLTVDVLKDGWVRVPIPAGLLVREAKLDGKLVSLVPGAAGKGSNQLAALLSRAGRAVLLLDIALPVVSTAGEESISLPSTASGVTRVSVRLPRQGVDIKLTGGLLAEKSEPGTDSKWLAYARGNEPLMFTWKRKTEDHRSTQALRLRGSLTELTGLGEDTTTVVAEVNVEVTQGAAREVRISLPDKVTVNQVAGAMVADWEMKDGQLAVTFLEPVEQNAKFIVSGETRSPRDGQIEIPLLRLLNAERDTGGVAVEVLGAGEIKEFKAEGLENADATDLSEIVSSRQSTSLSAFRYRAGDAKTARSLTVNVARYTPQAVLMASVAEARYNVLITNEGKLLVQARYAVRNNQRNFLKITLPQGATLWSASLAGKPVRPGQSPDGSVLLPLEKAHAGEDSPEFAVEVVYISRGTAWNDKGQFKLALPALDLPVSRTGMLVFHPPLFKVTPEIGSFRAEAYADPTSAALNPPAPPASVVRSFSVGLGAPAPAPPPPPPSPSAGATVQMMSTIDTNQISEQKLVDNFRATLQGGKAAGILPIKVSFEGLGPSLFLVSELTGENQSPSTDLNYQREKKAGGR
ncbi:MAG TPA: hypothetical protein VKH63_08785 [Candidatus Acidoferrum sp.]|nr:hypothetical protein [Candidatus Acidoferrum sp.]